MREYLLIFSNIKEDVSIREVICDYLYYISIYRPDPVARHRTRTEREVVRTNLMKPSQNPSPS